MQKPLEAMPAESTIASVLDELTQQLSACCDNPKLEANLLISHVLGKPRSHLIAFPESILDSGLTKNINDLLKRRRHGEPMAYLTGQQEFWSLPLSVNREVLVPRPETELLVELALHLPTKPQTIIDLGTGSGAIALALASEWPHADITAIDQSAAALQVAQHNARNLKIHNVKFTQSDWFEDVPNRLVDLCISNPPYIAAGDSHLTGDGVRHEPLSALVSGADGLDSIRQIIHTTPDYLNPGGYLMIEHGHLQGPAVKRLLENAGFKACTTHQDFNGNDRVTMGQKT